MKQRTGRVFATGFWGLIALVLFKTFPQGVALGPPAVHLFWGIAVAFAFPILSAFLSGAFGTGWTLTVGATLLASFFALRFQTPLLLCPIPFFWGLGVAAHFVVLSLWGRIRRSDVAIETLETEGNLLSEKERAAAENAPSLEQKQSRYASLSALTQLLSGSLVLREIAHLAVQKTYEVVGKSGAALLFLVNHGEEGLSLAHSFFEEGFPGTKSKKGDLFDHWVLKHRRPLLVRDVRNDFRFNPGRQEKREIGALIAAPLFSGEHVTGLLRLESLSPGAYTSEDLRLLSVIGDMVASSIENARLAQRTEELARVDELTGLYVHRYFQERLQEELVRAQRNRAPLSILMADIDRFKTYNDRYGHIAGDMVLKQVAQILKEAAGAGEMTCRYGGEEFSMVLPNRTKEEALALAEQIRASVEKESFVLRRENTHVTLSVGVAAFPEDGLTKDLLLKRMDEALYRAKREGRNRVWALS